MKVFSKSPAETKKIAAQLAGRGRVFALVGDLGAGKTTFVQGFAKALGVKNRIVSPTFLIFRNYKLKSGKYKKFYHVDLYRIESEKELNVLGFKKILNDPKNILLIEWAEKIKKVLPKDTIWVNFTHGRKETERIIAY